MKTTRVFSMAMLVALNSFLFVGPGQASEVPIWTCETCWEKGFQEPCCDPDVTCLQEFEECCGPTPESVECGEL